MGLVAPQAIATRTAAARVSLFIGEATIPIVEARPGRPLLERGEQLDALRAAYEAVAWGRLKARRGDADAFGPLDEALAVAAEHRRVEPVARVSPARAEAAWLSGDPDRVLAEVRDATARWPEVENPWWHGELAFWMRAAGGSPAPPVRPPAPYALWLDGDCAASAGWWRDRGCPYEAASALLFAADAQAVGEALETLDGLGARPAADWARRRLRELGVARVPRGPRASTLGNRAGLTRREHDVLLLVASGMSNREIAGRLFLSPKTVERHLSGILRKLDAGSRLEAVSAASRLGILRQRSD
jgi:DNA-binding CsgD family transcriptional regulator